MKIFTKKKFEEFIRTYDEAIESITALNKAKDKKIKDLEKINSTLGGENTKLKENAKKNYARNR